MPIRAGALSSPWTIGLASPTNTARIKSGSRAATVRRIRSAIHRLEFEYSRLDTGVALAGCHRERPLPRIKPGNGLAARRFGRIDGKEPACVGGRTWATGRRPFAGGAARAPSLRTGGRLRRMAAPDPDRSQPSCHRIRHLPPYRLPPSTGIGADPADAIGSLA